VFGVLFLYGNPAFLLVKLFYHQPYVTGVTKTSKTGLPLFVSYASGTTPSADLKQTPKSNTAKAATTHAKTL